MTQPDTSGEERQRYKYQWLDEFFEYLEGLKKKIPRLIMCGDYNIAHHAIDIHDPKGNKNNSGFLPEERAWMGQRDNIKCCLWTSSLTCLLSL
jgi:exodeoxyribonuclease-3